LVKPRIALVGSPVEFFSGGIAKNARKMYPLPSIKNKRGD